GPGSWFGWTRRTVVGGPLWRRLRGVGQAPGRGRVRVGEHRATEDRDHQSIDRTYAAPGVTEVPTMPDRHLVEFGGWPAPPASRVRMCANGFDYSGPRINLGDAMQRAQPESRQQHPVVVSHREQRAANLQLRVADWITGFAGSMPFVYIHAALFA